MLVVVSARMPDLRADAQPALCQVVSTIIASALCPEASTPNSVPAGKSSHGPVKDFGPNVLVSGAIGGQDTGRRIQNEVTITANQNNPENLVIGSHDIFGSTDWECAFYTSFDAGSTFPYSGYVPRVRPTDRCADPTLASDGAGNFYYSYLSVLDELSTSDITVSKSTDGGHTFGPPVVVFAGTPLLTFPDKGVITVDSWPTSPRRGTVYISWTLFDIVATPFFVIRTGCQILFSRSTDGGLNWSPAVSISPKFNCSTAGGPGENLVHGSMPVTSPDGTVYVAYYDSREDGWGPGLGGAGKFNVMLGRSGDGGTTFSSPVAVAEGDEMTERASAAPIRWWFSMFPAIAAGLNGDVGIVFASNPAGPDDGDILASLSLDRGATWRAPVRVNDDATTNDQFFPWLAVKQNDGTFHAIWGDRRNDPDDHQYEIYYAGSAGRGNSFRSNMRVTDISSNPETRQFIGDYFGIAASSVAVHPVWTDARRPGPDTGGFGCISRRPCSQQLDVFTARGTTPSA